MRFVLDKKQLLFSALMRKYIDLIIRGIGDVFRALYY